jgi:hypothetical protein
VDSKSDWIKKSGVTPAKLVLIGVLAVVLVVVLYLQFGRSGETATATLPTPTAANPVIEKPTPKAAAEAAPTPTGVPSKKTVVRGNWQTLDIASVIAHDPFALPASFPTPRLGEFESAMVQDDAAAARDEAADRAERESQLKQLQSQLSGLRQQGVHAIIKRDNQYVAIVGDQEIHVGDEINGFTVVAIDADGVRVAHDLSK